MQTARPGLFLLLLLAGTSIVSAAPLSAESKKDEFWQTRHKLLLERAKKGGADVVFLGDSLTQGWELDGKEVWKERFEPLKAVNFGVTGDKLQHLLWRVADGKELQGLKPRLVVLLAGTNNLGSDRHGQLALESDSPEVIAEGIKTIVGRLREELPDSKILLLGILPRAAGADAPVRGKIQEVNKRLAALADGDKVRFLDVGSKFLDKDGRIPEDWMPDALHLSPGGYKRFADALTPALQELLKKTAE
jgi:lysophospholipase L1-like esterase